MVGPYQDIIVSPKSRKGTKGNLFDIHIHCLRKVVMAALEETTSEYVTAEEGDVLQFPVRLSITTFNVWGAKFWPERSTNMTSLLNSLRSDIYVFQEVTPAILEYFDNTLTDYDRVKPSASNSEAYASWTTESNIYWNERLLTLVDKGKSPIDAVDYPNRALFWIRLQVKAQPHIKLFVATVHFPWQGCPQELVTGVNQRIPAAVKVCEALRKLLSPDEPMVLGGDFNDDFHPLRILQEELGLQEVYESLDLPPPITHPVRPSSAEEEMKANSTKDWILCSLPDECRVVAAFTKDLRSGGHGPVPSDHKPVTALLEIT